MGDIVNVLAGELETRPEYVRNVIEMLDEGDTIPFIARYRKEKHGAMGDERLRKLQERLVYLRNLDKRRETVLGTIEEQGKLTPELRQQIEAAATVSELEDLYRPYKPKRRTRAVIAAEKGLLPLAELLYGQKEKNPDPLAAAADYINPEKEVETAEEALKGASDIIAEKISDRADLRARLKEYLQADGRICCQAAKGEEDSVYRNYYDFECRIADIRGYQVLAVNRGEREGFLKVSVEYNRDKALRYLNRKTIRKQTGPALRELLEGTVSDSYDRLLFPSLEREMRAMLTEKACEGAIGQFAANLKPLLMQPPVKGSVVMGLDPGYAHGCKVAVVDPTGKVLDTAVVYPTFGEKQEKQAIERLFSSVRKNHVEHIAIGNGTACRETENMTAKLVEKAKNAGIPLSYMIVSEAGASVYSAGKLADEEFPDYDTNIRSAISIARRMQDPLAELVKIDPKSIGVGQYQHDMPQKQLSETLDSVVEDCVNGVGVDLNTASSSLLKRVSGLTNVTAKNIVAYRDENGMFRNRRELLKVPKLGPKAFEQCAGFLRVPESENVLDHTGVHPESYEAAGKLLQMTGYSLKDAGSHQVKDLRRRVEKEGTGKVAQVLGIGPETLSDIIDELMQPGRDIRDSLPQPVFKTGILSIEDLKPGMILDGTVRNVIDFGAFVDIGVHQDGLVHISQIADRFIHHPSEVLSVGDQVTVKVLDVDLNRKRISLSIRQAKEE